MEKLRHLLKKGADQNKGLETCGPSAVEIAVMSAKNDETGFGLLSLLIENGANITAASKSFESGVLDGLVG